MHTQPFNGLLFVTTRVGWYQNNHSPTHTHPDHRTSFLSFLHLLRSIASSLFSLRSSQSSLTTSFQVLFGLPLGLGPSTSYFMHFFTQSSSFRSTCPYQCSLFWCNTNVMSSIPNLSLSAPYLEICDQNAALAEVSPFFFPNRSVLTLMQHIASHTTTVQPSSHNQWCILIGKQW